LRAEARWFGVQNLNFLDAGCRTPHEKLEDLAKVRGNYLANPK